MFRRFVGGGIGHRNTRAACDWFENQVLASFGLSADSEDDTDQYEADQPTAETLQVVDEHAAELDGDDVEGPESGEVEVESDPDPPDEDDEPPEHESDDPDDDGIWAEEDQLGFTSL
jgi:hypothetical protein